MKPTCRVKPAFQVAPGPAAIEKAFYLYRRGDDH